MTRRDVPPVSPSGPSSSGVPGEVEYVRRLSLAILSTLQSKGLLSADEVDAILIAARRAAQGQARSPGAPQTVPAGVRPAPSMQVTVQPPGSLTWHTTPPSSAPGAEKQAAPVAELGEEVEEKVSAELGTPAAQPDEAASSSGGLAASQLAEPSAATSGDVGRRETQPDTSKGSQEDEPEHAAEQEKADSPEQRPQPPMFDIKLD